MRSKHLERDIVQVAAKHALAVHRDPEGGLTEHGIASCAAALALVLTDPTHPNHGHAMEKHLPPSGFEDGKPYDVYCECGQRVTRRLGAWHCPDHQDRKTVRFIERKL